MGWWQPLFPSNAEREQRLYTSVSKRTGQVSQACSGGERFGMNVARLLWPKTAVTERNRAKIIRASRCFAFSRQTAPATTAPRVSLTSVRHGNTTDSATSQPPKDLVQASEIFLEGRRFVAKSLLFPLLLRTGAPLITYLSIASFSKTMPFMYLSIASRSTLLYLQQFARKQCLSLDTSELDSTFYLRRFTRSIFAGGRFCS